MNKLLSLILVLSAISCTTIHFRSNNTVPVSFEGNPKHQKEVSITGARHFYFWGLDPEHHEVFVDDEVRQAIKDFSNWPTIPQLYIQGEFVGGSDIMYEMYQSGELQKLIPTQES